MKLVSVILSLLVIILIFVSFNSIFASELRHQSTLQSYEEFTNEVKINPSQLNKVARYIYNTDFSTANRVGEFLKSLEYNIEVIHIDDISNRSIEWDVGLIVIGADTGTDGIWGTQEQLDMLFKSKTTKFLSLGNGGLSFYENVNGLTVNWANSKVEDTKAIEVNNGLQDLWFYPNQLQRSFDVFTELGQGYILDESSLNSSVIIHGYPLNSPHPSLTYENNRFYYWGVQSSADIWTNESYKLLENIVTYLTNDGEIKTPELIGSPDLTYTEGSIGNIIQWTYYQILLRNYTVYMNDKPIFKEETNNGNIINYTVDDLLIGQYNFTIVLYDVLDNIYVDFVEVVVEKLDPDPILNHPEDIEFFFGETDYNITWYPIDDNPQNYQIYKNDTLIEDANWISGDQIFLSLDDLAVSLYNFTIQISDLSNQTVLDTVFVYILIDSEIPEIYFHGNFTFDELSENKTLYWSAWDLHPSRYRIYNSSSIIEEGFWINNQEKLLNFSSYELGSYNITFEIIDSIGNMARVSKILSILDMKLPVIDGPNAIYTLPGNSESIIDWLLTDEHPANYSVFIDGNLYFNGSWVENPFVKIPLSSFKTGVYNFTIIAEDSSHNVGIHIVRVYIDVESYSETINQGSTDTGLFAIKTEYLIGVGFVASIVVVRGLFRRRG